MMQASMVAGVVQVPLERLCSIITKKDGDMED